MQKISGVVCRLQCIATNVKSKYTSKYLLANCRMESLVYVHMLAGYKLQVLIVMDNL